MSFDRQHKALENQNKVVDMIDAKAMMINEETREIIIFGKVQYYKAGVIVDATH